MTDLARAVRPRRRVLLTTLRYPPQKGVGIFRTMKFQRHLPDYGWRADVLTGPREGDTRRQVVKEAAAEGEGAVFRVPFPDPDALARRLPEAASGRLTAPALDLLARSILVAGQRLMVPDAQLGFAWGVLGYCQEVVRPGTYDVLFSTGKTELLPGAMTTIDKLASFLAEYPAKTVLVEGHTDNVGSDTYNQDLSERRAISVKNALIQAGVNGSRIDTSGLGESQPITDNSTSAGRLKNRRVEIVIRD